MEYDEIRLKFNFFVHSICTMCARLIQFIFVFPYWNVCSFLFPTTNCILFFRWHCIIDTFYWRNQCSTWISYIRININHERITHLPWDKEILMNYYTANETNITITTKPYNDLVDRREISMELVNKKMLCSWLRIKYTKKWFDTLVPSAHRQCIFILNRIKRQRTA